MRNSAEIQTMKSGTLSVSIKTPERQLSLDNVAEIQRDLSLSGRQTYNFTRKIRGASGRNSVEYSIREKLRTKDHILDEHFEYRFMDCFDAKQDRVTMPVVICTDVQTFIDDLIIRKQIDSDHFAKIGIDNGKGFLKINLQLVENDCASGAQSSRACGINDIFIVAIGPDIIECYPNLKYLWHAVGLNKLTTKFMISADMTVCNLLLGLMSSGSSHPCPWCNAHKRDLLNVGESSSGHTLIPKRKSRDQKIMAMSYTHQS